MPTFQLSDPSGASYQVDAPDQDSALAAFSQMHGAPPQAPPDKYQQAATAKAATLKGQGVDTAYGPASNFLNGAMMGSLPTVMAGLTTPLSMIEHRTLSPAEGYDYAKAQEDQAQSAGQAEHPYLNDTAALAGGVMTGSGAASAGLTFVPQGAGALRTIGGMMGDGAAYGGLTGFLGGGNSLSDRTNAAMGGAATGAAIGLGLPVAGKVVSTLGAPIISNVMSRVNPEGAARASLARAVMESGQSPADLQAAIDNATASGQSNFTLADALGKSGQDMLSNVTRSPGPGAVQSAEFLENRQAGQGRQIANILSEGLGAPQTAQQTGAAMTAQRAADANANYGAARNGAGAVDVTPAIDLANQTLQPGVTPLMRPQTDIADNSIESAVARAKSFLTDGRSQISDFGQAFQAKQEIDNIISRATPQQQRALIPIKNALDDQLAAASPAYSAARDTFAAQSNAIDALPMGRNAAMRGRAEDTIPAYNALSPEAQSAYRVGYADPLIEQATSAAPGVNKVRPLLNDNASAELGNMSQFNGPYQPGAQDALAQRLGRENTMFETRARSLGGSKTFDNMQAEKGMGLDAMVLLDALRGEPMGLIGSVVRKGANALTGSTPAQRNALANLLLMHGTGADVQGAVGPTMVSNAQRAALVRALSAGGLNDVGLIQARANAQGAQRNSAERAAP